ncbi:hypothetical protein DER45DRAFT_224055 [Fusarium avenaceum]|nr:hypothetical protein DER45DRAFT_224055 [Fusarium avenaceum]
MNGNENLEKSADDNNEIEATSTAPFNCHQCRKSKLKCDRTRPCCSRCANQGYECVYSNSRQPYKSRTRGQAKEMEAKLGRLERLLQNSQTTKASHTHKEQHKSETLSVASITPPKDQDDEVVRLGLFEETPPREFIEILQVTPHQLTYTVHTNAATEWTYTSMISIKQHLCYIDNDLWRVCFCRAI